MTFSHLNKSAYSNHKSTEIGDHSPFQSGAVSRLEEAKRTIDSVIYDIEDQKDMNLSAFREVRGVNADVLEELRRGGFNEKENTSTFCPEYKSQSASNYQLRTPAPQEDNEMLRGMLNQEMKKNSALLLQMSRLDEENRMLKEQGYGGYDARGLQAEN